jgi:2-polyprenyl-3-methyl-5-hydroxy-6-metoxy-1,4-benzoquinol methylase
MANSYFNYYSFGLSRYINKVLLQTRTKAYSDFINEFNPSENCTILDVGVSENTHPSSNLLERLYPYKNNITGISTDNFDNLELVFPGFKFIQADGRDLKFNNNSFDISYSHAVIEHVGSFTQQKKFISELLRVSVYGVFFTTPSRWHPIDSHTGLPFIHWLPRTLHHKIYSMLGKDMYASIDKLNLLSKNDIINIILKDISKTHYINIRQTTWLFITSNINVVIKKINNI